MLTPGNDRAATPGDRPNRGAAAGARGAMRRINVIGTSGVGKSTFAVALAARLGYRCVELDELHWGPNWTEAEPGDLRCKVDEATAGETWVVDGNYSAVRDIVWPRADTIVWLDLHRSVVTWRIVIRSVSRIARRTMLWGDNRESLPMLLGRDSIIWWSVSTYARHRRDYPALIAAHPHLQLIRLRSPRGAERWLRSLPQRPARAATTPGARASAQKP